MGALGLGRAVCGIAVPVGLADKAGLPPAGANVGRAFPSVKVGLALSLGPGFVLLVLDAWLAGELVEPDMRGLLCPEIGSGMWICRNIGGKETVRKVKTLRNEYL